MTVAREARRRWIDPEHPRLSVTRQCDLAGVPRSSHYHVPKGAGETAETLHLMRVIDTLYMKRPFYGVPRMTGWLRDLGHGVNHKRVERLMRRMGLQAALPGPHTSRPHPKHRIYPYLLRGMEVLAPNEVWSSDITYIPLRRGYLYLVAVLDWFSRYVLSWEVSNSMETRFCIEALDRALTKGRPGIFNTDQGAQFTSEEFTERLTAAGIRISMDGRGRALDNVFVERLWRSVKYEDVYPHDYADGSDLREGLRRYFRFYNTERRHQGLEDRTPAEAHGLAP